MNYILCGSNVIIILWVSTKNVHFVLETYYITIYLRTYFLLLVEMKKILYTF